MTEYKFSPEQLNFSKTPLRIASTPEEMAAILFTTLFARVKYLDMQPFSAEELEEEMGDRDYDTMTKKALAWIAQL